MNWFLKLFKKNNKIDTTNEIFIKNKAIYKHYYFVNYNKLNKWYKFSKYTELNLTHCFEYPDKIPKLLSDGSITESEIAEIVKKLFYSIRLQIDKDNILQYC